jgi:hypothetical protein
MLPEHRLRGNNQGPIDYDADSGIDPQNVDRLAGSGHERRGPHFGISALDRIA